MIRTVIFIACCAITFVAEGKVKLAVSNATSGPASELGRDLNRGAELYFSAASATPVELDKRDDGYEPNQAMQNTMDFAAVGHQLLFNYVGTPTTKSIINYTYAKKLALITPYTGADFLRQASAIHIFNLRASYQQEAELQAKYLVEQLGLSKVAIVIQADDFGLAFEKFFVNELDRYGIKPTLIARFKRNSKDVSKVVSQINKAKLDAVAFIGPYAPMAALVNQTYQQQPDLVYASVSFVSSAQLASRIPRSTKLLVTEVVPDPKACQFIECQRFRAQAKKQDVTINHGTFEGYLNAYWLDSALANCQPDFAKLCVTKQLSEQKVKLLGKTRAFQKQNRQLLNEVYTTVFNLPKPKY